METRRGSSPRIKWEISGCNQQSFEAIVMRSDSYTAFVRPVLSPHPCSLNSKISRWRRCSTNSRAEWSRCSTNSRAEFICADVIGALGAWIAGEIDSDGAQCHSSVNGRRRRKQPKVIARRVDEMWIGVQIVRGRSSCPRINTFWVSNVVSDFDA